MKKKMIPILLLHFVLFIHLDNLQAKSNKEKNSDPLREKLLNNHHPPAKSSVDPRTISGKVPVPPSVKIPASALTNSSVGKGLPPTIPTTTKVGQGSKTYHSGNSHIGNKSQGQVQKSLASKTATTYGQSKTVEEKPGATKTPQEKTEKTEKVSNRPVKTENKSKMKMRVVAPGEE